MTEPFDLIVLGGGRASRLAMAAASAGKKTALIERDKLGGACPNRGCVPSKLLVGFAEAARHVRDADVHLIDAEYRGADVRRMFESVNEYVGGVDGRYEKRVERAGVTLLRGDGRFVGPKTVAVGQKELVAEQIVVATGSRPTRPPFTEFPVWTSDDLFPLKAEPPKSLLVIGGGSSGGAVLCQRSWNTVSSCACFPAHRHTERLSSLESSARTSRPFSRRTLPPPLSGPRPVPRRMFRWKKLTPSLLF